MTGPSEEASELIEQVFRLAREKALADHHHDDWANTHCTCDLRALLGESS